MNTFALFFASLLNPIFMMGWLVLGLKSFDIFNGASIACAFVFCLIYIPIFEWVRDDVLGGC